MQSHYGKGRGGAPSPSQSSRAARSGTQSPNTSGQPQGQPLRFHPATNSTAPPPSAQQRGFQTPHLSQRRGPTSPASQPRSHQPSHNALPPAFPPSQYQTPQSRVQPAPPPPPPSSALARSPTLTQATLDDDDEARYFEEDDESFVNTFHSLFEADEVPAPAVPDGEEPPLEIWNIYAGLETGTFTNRDFVRQSLEGCPGALCSRHYTREDAAYAWLMWTRSLTRARAELQAAYGGGVLPEPLPNGLLPVVDSWPAQHQPSQRPQPSQSISFEAGPSQPGSSQPWPMTPEQGPSSPPSSPRKYDARPVFAMVSLSQLTPSTLPDLSGIVRQNLPPGTPYQSHSKKNYYAIARGHLRTIVNTWEECELLTREYHHPVFKGFMRFSDAIAYMRDPDSA